MNPVIWLGILTIVYLGIWNIYTKLIKNEGEELFIKNNKGDSIKEEELDY